MKMKMKMKMNRSIKIMGKIMIFNVIYKRVSVLRFKKMTIIYNSQSYSINRIINHCNNLLNIKHNNLIYHQYNLLINIKNN
jgi:hypothetical protein